jgi:hypothetical protein
MRPLLAVVLALALGACDSQVRSAPAPDAEPAASPAPPPSDPVVQTHMKVHFAKGAAVRDAIAMGDLAAARTGFTALAEHPMVTGLPEGTAPLVAGFQDAARAGAKAGDTSTQARALADTARACGGCHALVGARPTWEVPDAPPRDPGVRPHMARHAWAVDRMYEGLVGPTEGSWSQAAAILNDHALDEAVLPSGTDLSPVAEAAGARLHALGKEALAAETPEARGELFAEALSTCATCHAAAGVGKTAPPR